MRTPARSRNCRRPSSFGWPVAPSSTILQPSEVHTGLTAEPAATLDRLLRSLVG